jgi:biopolymer transport protein ExbD
VPRLLVLLATCILAAPALPAPEEKPRPETPTLIVREDRSLFLFGHRTRREDILRKLREVVDEREREGLPTPPLRLRMEADPNVPDEFLESLGSELDAAGARVVETVRAPHPVPHEIFLRLRVAKDGRHELKLRRSGWGSFDRREKVLTRILEVEKGRSPAIRVWIEAEGDVARQVVVRAIDAVMLAGIADIRFRSPPR